MPLLACCMPLKSFQDLGPRVPFTVKLDLGCFKWLTLTVPRVDLGARGGPRHGPHPPADRADYGHPSGVPQCPCCYYSRRLRTGTDAEGNGIFTPGWHWSSDPPQQITTWTDQGWTWWHGNAPHGHPAPYRGLHQLQVGPHPELDWGPEDRDGPQDAAHADDAHPEDAQQDGFQADAPQQAEAHA